MEHDINITSEIKNICNVEYFINSIFKELVFSRKIYCKIYLAINEAVVNSIIHGNKSDPSKFVFISFKDEPDCYRFTVLDQGEGFDYKHLQSPLSIDNLVKENGRGIFIMKQYSDTVFFEDNGRKVTMIFNK